MSFACTSHARWFDFSKDLFGRKSQPKQASVFTECYWLGVLSITVRRCNDCPLSSNLRWLVKVDEA